VTVPVRTRTRRLERDVDLLAVAGRDGYLFEQGGLGLAGRGEALRLPVADAARLLAAMDVEDEVELPGTGPVAFGALPFAASPGSTVVVPEVVVGRDGEGNRWITTVDGAEAALPTPDTPAVVGGAITLRPARPADEWCEAVAEARRRIREGQLVKCVLARELLVHAEHRFDPLAVLTRLRAAFPSAYLFSVDGFLGASPELLVSRQGAVVRSHPLAGTSTRSGDPAVDARLAAQLVASTKDQLEHRVTIEMVHDALLPWCSYLDAEAEPSVVAVANVQHLGTLVEGRLSSPPPSVLELVTALHPTPAVGGWPRAEALALIEELEGADRGRYAGPVGWVDARGNGRWAVGIRSGELDGHDARVFAGVGVVAGSDPAAELAETQAKFQAMLGALIRP